MALQYIGMGSGKHLIHRFDRGVLYCSKENRIAAQVNCIPKQCYLHDQ
ncbi:hypothetical protein [Rufibacter tibetensis]|nr:hypothetical protein [Rufibacter tibetensis]